jgi:hypothetical protein
LYAFDLLELDGADWLQRRLEERKGALERLLAGRIGVRISEHIEGGRPNHFRARLPDGLGRDRVEAPRSALSQRAGEMLDQD